MEDHVRVLLSFVDLKDPFVPTGVAGESELGPVLSMMAARPYDAAVLFHTPHNEERAEATAAACRERYPECKALLSRLSVSDPKDYSQVMGALGREIVELPEAEYSVCVSSGTAEMRTAWFMLVSSGVLRAKLLQLGSPAQPLFGPAHVKEVELGDSPWGTLRDLVMPQEFFVRRYESSPRTRASRAMDLSESVQLRQPIEEREEAPELEAALAELGLFVHSAVTRELVERAAIAAGTSISVLVTGETGTGKEKLARLVHRLSERRGGPFLAVNCATIHDLTESQLFGHKKGAFTGADRDHRGFFEQANGGTLFLDELGELPLKAQASLLRVLENQEVQPLGAQKPVKVNVRLVAATNRNLQEEIAKGRFREDLYHRLSVAPLRVTPLRERRSEIAPLALQLLEAATQRLAKRRTLTRGALARLTAHDWPGNVRELGNTIERSVLFSPGTELGVEDLLLEGAWKPTDDGLGGLPEPREGFQIEDFLGKVRRKLILRALEMTGGNQAQAAKLLGISKQAVSAFQKGLDDNAD